MKRSDMRCSQRIAFALIFSALPGIPAKGEIADFEFSRLDGFEDASPWVKGDPNTDLQQKDAAVTTSREFFKEGKQSLAFLIRVNWTKRDNEQYAKGWPMMRRVFQKPRDWSEYDYLFFWVYAKTKAGLQQERVLRIGFPPPDTKSLRTWHTISGIRPNQWVQAAVPLTAALERKNIGGISFYVAEGWYEDGDKVDFFIDDMRLAKRTIPALASCSLTSRTSARGKAVELRVSIEGPLSKSRVRCKVTDTQGKEQLRFAEKLAAREQRFAIPAKGLPAGGHYGEVDLLDKKGQVVAAEKKYFRSMQPGKRCYLKLITFYTKPVGIRGPESLKVLNDSAYAGVAMPLIGSYSREPIPEYDALKPKLKTVRDALMIDVWPWVALNRMIGASENSGHRGRPKKNMEYFERIKALDLDNEAGARADFLKLWRNAVRTAREWKSPGIMWDPEAYNNYRACSVGLVAKERGESVDEVIRKSEQIGADMAKAIQEEYPKCVVWSLFSRLELSQTLPSREGKIFTTASYIVLGLLKYAKVNRVPLKFLCGGETMPGYCNKSVDMLKQKIADRDRAVAPILEQFPDHFFLAGTISPFHDYTLATDWIKRGYAGSPFKTINDFEPMFRTLFDAYDWVWIYASSAAKTLPYDPEKNRIYSDVLRTSLDGSEGRN